MYKEQKMMVHWQQVGCLLVVPYTSFTSLIAVSSGETTGYVHVITVDTEAAGWPYWMRMTVLESGNVDSSKYTPKVPYGSSFTATRTAKSSPLTPDMPTLSLTSSWEWCDGASDHPLYSVTHWGTDLRVHIPWSLIQVRCYVDWSDI